jgi:hypothetical protein
MAHLCWIKKNFGKLYIYIYIYIRADILKPDLQMWFANIFLCNQL